jgi:hypothetical protein
MNTERRWRTYHSKTHSVDYVFLLFNTTLYQGFLKMLVKPDTNVPIALLGVDAPAAAVAVIVEAACGVVAVFVTVVVYGFGATFATGIYVPGTLNGTSEDTALPPANFDFTRYMYSLPGIKPSK